METRPTSSLAQSLVIAPFDVYRNESHSTPHCSLAQGTEAVKRLLCMLFTIVAVSAHVLHASEFVLIDSAANINVSEFEKSETDFPQLRTGPWRVEKQLLHGGKQEGTELIVVSNGKLRFGVSPTRGLSVVFLEQVANAKFPVGWKSPVTEIVHPQFIDLESRSGLGWLDGFNEWMCRCGLEFAGHPGKDTFTTNTGEKGELTLTLHGKIGNTPASRVVFSVDDAPPHRIRIKGTAFERSFHGPNLKLEAEVSTVPGTESIEIHDRVTNLGGSPQEFQLIYHTNYGPPILEKGSRIVSAIESLEPMNDRAAEGVDRWNTCEGPTPGFVEQVYLAHAAGDADGSTSVMIENASGSRGASVSWNINQLPYLTVWKNTASQAEGYVTGLEPGTGFPFNRWVERHFGRVPTLKPGESREFSLSFSVHPDKASVQKMRQRIEAIQQRTPASISTTAPKIPEFDANAD
ncbi:aldose 1-epimerase family protein [Lacipirellula parvula]|uniref:DUF4432 domain-containing protein n=1 Tax=Lacipirellula parvula TaxID=2650471 RepID=A0A5K7XGX7_9BACT|nr:aldose 1-epimerase family protein [Lacipirellula parvula]BBO35247.1 hypothetical protein PLANPX_4859 [Lacipirellula parvula]